MHPGIATLHGFEESGGTRFLVMELVEGETLADRISRGPIPEAEAVAIAAQIAHALEAAHEHGVVHRDLKPANVALSSEGAVKVLDFGLAKAFLDDGKPVDDSLSPTLTNPSTREGVILGTAAYMSPEQARGKTVDKRSDIFAFGCVLYEMLTGERAFGGDSVTDILAAVIRSEPALDRLPHRLRPLVARCLAKDARARYRDMGDVRFDLEQPSPASGADAPPRPQRWWLVAAAAVVGLGLGMATTLRTPDTAPVTRTTITPSAAEPHRLVGSDPSVAISTDGRLIAYNSGSQYEASGITVHPLDKLYGERLSELPAAVDSPFLSPDGEWLGFDDGGARLGRVSVRGGPPRTICRLDGALRGAAWGVDGSIVYATQAPDTGLLRVAASGGEPQPLTTPASGEGDHRWPDILPDGRHILFAIVDDGAIGDTRIALLDVETGEYRVLIEDGTSPRYAPTGHIVYAGSGVLLAVGFDLDRLEVLGDPRPVLDGVLTIRYGSAEFGLSREGSLVYVTSPPVASWRGGLVWVTRDGRVEAPISPPDLEEPLDPTLSPDARRVALRVAGDLWVYDVGGRPPLRLTTDARVRLPLWTPDGGHLLYTVLSARRSVFALPADGSGGEPQAVSPEGNFLAHGWSATGEEVIAGYNDGPQRDIVRWSLSAPERFEPVVQTPAFEGNRGLAVSPDGRWLAYASDRDGEPQIWVQPYPGPGAAQRVSPDGGTFPVWARDGRELYYVEGTRLMAVAVHADGGARFSEPVALFDRRATATDLTRFDVAPDGRFLMVRRAEGETAAEPPRIVLVQNFFEELRRLVPRD